MPEVVQSFVLSKGYDVRTRPKSSDCVLSKSYDNLPHSMLSNHVYNPRAIMECHVRHCSFVCVIKIDDGIATTDVVRH